MGRFMLSDLADWKIFGSLSCWEKEKLRIFIRRHEKPRRQWRMRRLKPEERDEPIFRAAFAPKVSADFRWGDWVVRNCGVGLWKCYETGETKIQV